MNAHEGCRAHTIGKRNPRWQVNIDFPGSGHAHINTPGAKQRSHLERHIQHDIGLPKTANADGTRIRPTMPGIDDDAIAPFLDDRQT